MVVLQWSFGGGGGGGGRGGRLTFFLVCCNGFLINRKTYDINPLSHTTSFLTSNQGPIHGRRRAQSINAMAAKVFPICLECNGVSFDISKCRKQNDMSDAFKVTCKSCTKSRTFCVTCDRFIKKSERNWSTHKRQSRQHRLRTAQLKMQNETKQQDEDITMEEITMGGDDQMEEITMGGDDQMDELTMDNYDQTMMAVDTGSDEYQMGQMGQMDELMDGNDQMDVTMDNDDSGDEYTVYNELLHFRTTEAQYDNTGTRLTLPSYGKGFNEQPTPEELAALEARAAFLGLDSRCVTSMNPLLNEARAPDNLLDFVQSGWGRWMEKKLNLHKSSASSLPDLDSNVADVDVDFDAQVDKTVLHMHLNCFLSVISSTSTHFEKVANTNRAIQQASTMVVLQQLKKKHGIDIKAQAGHPGQSDKDFCEAMNNDVVEQLKLATTDKDVHNFYIEKLFRRWPIPKFKTQLNHKGEDVGLDVNDLLQITLFHFQRKNISIHAKYAEKTPHIIENTHDSPAITGKAVPLQYQDVVVWKLNCHGKKGTWICFNHQDAQEIWAAKRVCAVVIVC